MKKGTYKENSNGELAKQYSKLQLNDFKEIKKLFEDYIFGFGNWNGIVCQLSAVLDKCDEIDYEETETAFAYAVWHFLDRYHRFQIIIDELWKQGYLRYKKARKIDILEVGSGPAQGLFAFSEHYAELNKLENEDIYSIQSDYVEQSQGFRSFLHHFVEYAMEKDKYYMVPFHFGRGKDAFNFKFEEDVNNWWGGLFKQKYRYDIVVISNFLTTQSTVEDFKKQLTDICKYMRNYGVLIVVGASDSIDKYKDIYSSVDGIVNRKFGNRNFLGWWNKVYEKTYTYNYSDEYGALLRDYYRTLKEFITGNNLWDFVPEKAQDNLMDKINQTREKTLAENWEGVHWKVVVYQKHCFYRGKNDRKIVKSNFKIQDESGWRRSV